MTISTAQGENVHKTAEKVTIVMEITVKTRINSSFKRTLGTLRLAQIVIALAVLLFSSVCLAADLSNESLAGTWNFTPMESMPTA